jgi:hypothetical protein
MSAVRTVRCACARARLRLRLQLRVCSRRAPCPPVSCAMRYWQVAGGPGTGALARLATDTLPMPMYAYKL